MVIKCVLGIGCLLLLAGLLGLIMALLYAFNNFKDLGEFIQHEIDHDDEPLL